MSDQAHWGARILRVVDHVHGHLDEELAPESLAKIAGFSPHHFHRVFRGMTGESVMGFVRRLRLERAAQRLEREDTAVTAVAFDTTSRIVFGPSPRCWQHALGRAHEPQVDVFRGACPRQPQLEHEAALEHGGVAERVNDPGQESLEDE